MYTMTPLIKKAEGPSCSNQQSNITPYRLSPKGILVQIANQSNESVSQITEDSQIKKMPPEDWELSFFSLANSTKTYWDFNIDEEIKLTKFKPKTFLLNSNSVSHSFVNPDHSIDDSNNNIISIPIKIKQQKIFKIKKNCN